MKWSLTIICCGLIERLWIRSIDSLVILELMLIRVSSSDCYYDNGWLVFTQISDTCLDD